MPVPPRPDRLIMSVWTASAFDLIFSPMNLSTDRISAILSDVNSWLSLDLPVWMSTTAA